MIKKYAFYTAIALFALTTCKKNNNSNPVIPVTPVAPVTPVPPVKTTDVYIAGSTSRMAGNVLYTTATYWKNGIAVRLADTTSPTAAYAIAVNGNDIYVAGMVTDTINLDLAAYWKNGSLVQLANGPYRSVANAIAVSGNDVYAGGFTINSTTFNEVATYWKNGTPINLTDGTSEASISSIVFNGTDFYASGTIGNSAVVWKNGVATYLTTGPEVSIGAGMTVNGSDVYVTGYMYVPKGNAIATYWKNGVATQLSTVAHAGANCIAVNGNNVYVGGNESDLPVYWMNGTPVNLSANINYTGGVTGIAVSGSDVYAASDLRSLSSNIYVASFLKNLVPTTLGNAASTGGMVLVTH